MNFLVAQIDRLITALRGWSRANNPDFGEKYQIASSEALQFLKDYAGDTHFYKNANTVSSYSTLEENSKTIIVNLQGYRNYITSGLSSAVSLERRAQIEVVSDFLGQAEDLLNDKDVHSAVPIVITGAALEEFLRNWCDEDKLLDGNTKGSIDKYAQALKAKDFITKQDVKDITSWGGLRNEAAHGHWESTSNRDTARLMLMGVNYFMRKYSPEGRG